MPKLPPVQVDAREEFDELIKSIRPKLHRYSARMTGSVVDAEDVVQDALAKAYYQMARSEIDNLESWLIRIVHHKAIDHLRSAKRSPIDFVEKYPPMSDETAPLETEETTAFALSIYLQLTPLQRSSVILKDVIGYSLSEVSEILDVSVGAVKAALHRGRGNLRKVAKTADSDALPLNTEESKLLSQYVDLFNARDFDGVRAMLADDVRLDLLERKQAQGVVNVGRYFGNYSQLHNLLFTLGYVEGKPAILVSELNDPSQFEYLILIEWKYGQVVRIRDYRFVPLVMQDADITVQGLGK